MRRFLMRPFAYALVFSALLAALSAYVLMDAFVFERAIANVSDAPAPAEGADPVQAQQPSETAAPVSTDSSYDDGRISVALETLRVHGTTVYLASVRLDAAELLKTAFARDTFGLNIGQPTSQIAQAKQAVLAVNGDYYGARKNGYVIKNGVLYRQSVRNDPEYDDLVIDADGAFRLVNERTVSAEELLFSGARQLFCFGPALVMDGDVVVEADEEVSRSMSSNPRTALGVVAPLHYLFVVSDGRTEESRGLTLYQLAEIMAAQGCQTAYNLDGGGSSTMYFNGRVINQPTTSGRTISEREVSDIVYIGYA